MKTHDLKTWPCFFEPILEGRKSFEIRENDRDFKVGDRLNLREYIPPPASDIALDPEAEGTYTGRSILVVVTYMTDFAKYPGTVVMGISRQL